MTGTRVTEPIAPPTIAFSPRHYPGANDSLNHSSKALVWEFERLANDTMAQRARLTRLFEESMEFEAEMRDLFSEISLVERQIETLQSEWEQSASRVAEQ